MAHDYPTLPLQRFLSLRVGEAFELKDVPADDEPQPGTVAYAERRWKPAENHRHASNAMAGIKNVAGLLGWCVDFARTNDGTLVMREPARPRDLASPRRKFTGPVIVGDIHRPTGLHAARDELMQSRLLDAERVRTMKPGDSFRVEAAPKRSMERRSWIRQAAVFTGRVVEIERLTPKRHEKDPPTEVVMFEVRCVGTQPGITGAGAGEP